MGNKLEYEDDGVLVKELEELTILVETEEAAQQIKVDQDTFITGGSAKNFTPPKKITAGSVHDIKPPSDRFAIVVHTDGKKIVDGAVEVFLGEEMLPYKVEVYDEAKKNKGLALNINIKKLMKFVVDVVQKN